MRRLLGKRGQVLGLMLLRLAVSLGGDSDTLAAITCSMAEAAWDVPPEIADRTADLLDPFLRDVLDRWEGWRAGALRSRSLEF